MLEHGYYPSLTKRIFLEQEGIDLNLLEELNYFQNLTSSATFIYNPTIMELLNHTKYKLIKNYIFPSEK